ncbi:hypothetical protein CEXT_771131 [Caerostris extrusa]|uniref:Uncharacterized protein n=1 Tax=Caerostris extrusa TaxID=172846 RepID=A0AAV4PP75_CAEEX|nr:hypothetical protein CEXT_771131 [Caerostris extrusa]
MEIKEIKTASGSRPAFYPPTRVQFAFAIDHNRAGNGSLWVNDYKIWTIKTCTLSLDSFCFTLGAVKGVTKLGSLHNGQ